jgi:hypothetical protein
MQRKAVEPMLKTPRPRYKLVWDVTEEERKLGIYVPVPKNSSDGICDSSVKDSIKCKFCDLYFIDRIKSWQHKLDKHEDEKEEEEIKHYKCKLCDVTFPCEYKHLRSNKHKASVKKEIEKNEDYCDCEDCEPDMIILVDVDNS